MPRKKKGEIEVTTDNDLGKFLTGNHEVKYSDESLRELKYELEILPSGKSNLCNRNEFKVNGFKSTRSKGFWIKTFDCSIKELPNKIITLEFV